MKRISLLSFLVVCVPVLIFAQEKPTSNETRKVLDYYYHGQGKGAVLKNYKFCHKIKESECDQEITDRKIIKGQKVILWMDFLVPVGDKADMYLEFRRKNKVRKVVDFVVSGSIRYRTYQVIPTKKTGDWVVNIIQEVEDKDMNLGELRYTVVDQ
jgi:hypothetical protein